MLHLIPAAHGVNPAFYLSCCRRAGSLFTSLLTCLISSVTGPSGSSPVVWFLNANSLVPSGSEKISRSMVATCHSAETHPSGVGVDATGGYRVALQDCSQQADQFDCSYGLGR